MSQQTGREHESDCVSVQHNAQSNAMIGPLCIIWWFTGPANL
jgi:hypothetical protein